MAIETDLRGWNPAGTVLHHSGIIAASTQQVQAGRTVRANTPRVLISIRMAVGAVHQTALTPTVYKAVCRNIGVTTLRSYWVKARLEGVKFLRHIPAVHNLLSIAAG